MIQKSDRSATKVLIVDDHPVVLSGCRSLFASDNTVKIEEATDQKPNGASIVHPPRLSRSAQNYSKTSVGT
jgi:DNA-binding NarL/FixJ family response regulator